MLNDRSRPLRERLAEFGRAVATEDPGDDAELAMFLEFFAALLRAPDALQRYSSGLERRLQELADADSDEPAAGARSVQAWARASGRPADLPAPGPRPGHAGGLRARAWPAGRPLPGAVRTTRSRRVAGRGGGIRFKVGEATATRWPGRR